MSEHTALLAREQRKLAWLKEKVADQERRVRTLEALREDPLDEVFERESFVFEEAVQTPAQQEPASRQPVADAASRASLNQLLQPVAAARWTRRPRQLPPNWVRILGFIGREGKTYAQVKAFVVESGLAISADAVRTGLMNYRKDFGLVENPKRGFYVATERAMEALGIQENESPATKNGSEASEPQPT